jgi:hypothetical protein
MLRERLAPGRPDTRAYCPLARCLNKTERLVGLGFYCVITRRSKNNTCSSCSSARTLLLPRMLARARLLLRYACTCCCSCTWGPPRLLRFPCTWGPLRLRGPPPLRLLPAPAHGTLAIKNNLLQLSSEIDETFTTYYCNICLQPLQHMQHPDKTFATYI